MLILVSEVLLLGSLLFLSFTAIRMMSVISNPFLMWLLTSLQFAAMMLLCRMCSSLITWVDPSLNQNLITKFYLFIKMMNKINSLTRWLGMITRWLGMMPMAFIFICTGIREGFRTLQNAGTGRTPLDSSSLSTLYSMYRLCSSLAGIITRSSRCMVICLLLWYLTQSGVSATNATTSSSTTGKIPAHQMWVNRTILSSVVGTETLSNIYMVDRYHKFTQTVNFDLMHKEVHGLQHLLKNINPKEVGEFTSVRGVNEYFLVSNSIATESLNRLKCAEQDAQPITFQTLRKEKLKVDRTVILADKVKITGDSFSCKNHDSEITGTFCIRMLQQWADSSSLTFMTVPERQYVRELQKSFDNAILHLSINGTHMFLSEHPSGYAICNDSGNKTSSAKFAEIVKGKYFDHLGRVCSAILDTYDVKITTLQRSFILAIERQFSGFTDKSEASQVCDAIRKLSFQDCIGIGRPSQSTEFDFFEQERSNFILLDDKIRKVTQHALAACKSEDRTSHRFLYSVFTQYVNIHMVLGSMLEAYLPEHHQLDIKRILVSQLTSGIDIQGCVNQLIGSHLSTAETQNVLHAIYTSKIFFAMHFRDKGESFVWPGTNSSTANPRTKRYVWTDPLSGITGLAKQTDIGVLSRNTDKVLSEANQNAQEIVHLEHQANIVLDAVKSQNEKVLRLYQDEKSLHDRLRSLLEDEQSVTVQIGHIVDALEVQSDVDIEYSSFMSSLAIMSTMIADTESQVLSVLTQHIRPEMIPFDNPNAPLQYFAVESFAMVKVRATVTLQGFQVQYELPELSPPYKLVQVRTLPFPVKEGVYQRFVLESDKVAIGPEGKIFLYAGEPCPSLGDTTICEYRMVEIHARPVACVEFLARNPKEIPDRCLNSMQFFLTNTQMYLYHEDGQNVTIFSPYEDKARIVCELNRTVSSVLDLVLHEGLSMVLIPAKCVLTTTDLVVHSAVTSSSSDGRVPTVSRIDLATELTKLADDLEVIHEVNTSQLAGEFLSFATELGIENADIGKIAKSIANFKAINSIVEYHPAKISLETPDAMSNTVTVVAWLVALLILAVGVTCCYMCCAPCKTCVDACCLGMSCCCKCMSKCCPKGSTRTRSRAESPAKRTPCKLEVSTDSLYTTPRYRVRRKLSTSTQESRIDMDDSASWQLNTLAHRVVLSAQRPSGKILWNLSKGRAETEDGVLVTGEPRPSSPLLSRASAALASLPPPRIAIRDGQECLENEPNIVFDRANKVYVSRKTGRLVGNVRLPS